MPYFRIKNKIVPQIFVLFLFTMISFSASAKDNDLIIESFKATFNHNGSVISPASFDSYFTNADILDLNFDFKVSWYCGTLFKVCSNPLPPDRITKLRNEGAFDASLVLEHRTPLGSLISTHTLTTFDVYSAQISYRGLLSTNIVVSKTISLKNRTALDDWLANARYVKGYVQLKLKIDTTNAVLELNEANNEEIISMASPIPLNGILVAGNFSTQLETITSIQTDVNCGTSSGPSNTLTNLRINGSSLWNPSPVQGGWNEQMLSVISQCVRFDSLPGPLVLTNSSNGLVANYVTGTIGGYDAIVEHVELWDSGINASTFINFSLPKGHTIHNYTADGAEAYGRRHIRTVIDIPSNISDFNNISVSLANAYLHVNDFPFLLGFQNFFLSSNGINGQCLGVRYAYDFNYVATDKRRFKKPHSNDQIFSRPVSCTSFSIPQEGLATEIEFDPVTAYTHFPKTTLSAAKKKITINSGKIIDTQIVDIDKWEFTLNPDCAGCTSGGTERKYNLTGVTPSFMDDDGAYASSITLDTLPEWGKWDTAKNRFIFARPLDDGINGLMLMPGFSAKGTDTQELKSVADYLMGARDTDKVQFKQYFDLTTNMTQDGNHFMSGANFGPQIYSDIDNIPDVGTGISLSGKPMAILFGGVDAPDYTNIANNIGTKYVIRPEGITGVFNFDSSPSTLKMYDYNFSLRRVGFRQVDNALDDYSWIDGSVEVPGKGNFIVNFDSLALQCSGDIAGGMVPHESSCTNSIDDNGNGIIDENCNVSFRAWRTPVELLSMRFAATTPQDACATQTRELLLGNSIKFSALEEPLGMEAFWSSAGEVSQTKITGDADNVLDKNASNKGLNVVLKEDFKLLTPANNTSNQDGWAAFDTTIGVPFWNAMQVSSRVANSSESAAMASLIHNKGDFLGSENTYNNSDNDALAAKLKDYPFDVDYTWGDTGIGLSLPVYYDKPDLGVDFKSQFLGIKKEGFDLPVMRTNAGVDYITPDNTKISFGASAEFELKAQLDLNLHVDISDENSVIKMDEYLCRVSGFTGCSSGSGPVGTLVDGMYIPMDRLNEYANSGIEDIIEKAIKKGVDSIRIGQLNPFDEIADKLNAIQSLPDLVATNLSLKLQSMSDEMLSKLSTTLNSQMDQVYTDLSNFGPINIDVTLVTNPNNYTDAQVAKLTVIINNLDSVSEALSSVNGVLSDTDTTMQNGVTEFNRLVDETKNKAVELTGILSQTKTTIEALDLCGSAGASTDNVMGSAMELITYIRESNTKLKNIVDSTNVGGMSIEDFNAILSIYSNVDISPILSVQEQLKLFTNQLEERISSLETTIEAKVCLGPNANLVSEVSSFLDKLITGLTLADAKLTALQAAVADPGTGIITTAQWKLGLIQNKVTALDSRINDVKSFLETHRDKLQSDTGFVKQPLDYLIESGSLTLEPTWNPQQSADFITGLTSILREPIDEAIGDIIIETHTNIDAITSNIPHPTSDELKAMVVMKIMNTDAVENIHNIIYEQTSEIVEEVNNLYGIAFTQINHILNELILALETRANELLANATGELTADINLGSGKVDGYAQIGADELERLHIEAEFKTAGSEDSSMTYKGALDITSWSTNGKADGCGVANANGLLDAKITAYGLPVSIGSSNLDIKELFLGFTLDNAVPIGAFGGIYTDGSIKFQTFELYDVGFEAGLGIKETYSGARAAALFEDVQMEAAFLVGKTCNTEVLTRLDPQVGEFIDLPANKFSGAFFRGGASVPVYSNGCALTVGVVADVGGWVLIDDSSTSIGGLVGGGAFGKALCIASIKGKVTAIGQYSNGEFSFLGEGWGAAGAGSCSPSGWNSVSKSRKDSWCGTGDARFEAEYKNGWRINDLSTSAIH